MSRTEASWHETQAGMRAAAAARAAGEDPQLVAAVVDSTLPRMEVGRYVVKPATKGTVMAIQRVAPLLLEWAESQGMAPAPNPAIPGELEMLETAFTIMVFADPRRIYRETAAGLPQDLIAEAEALVWEMPATQMVPLQDALEREMRAVGLTGPSEDDQAEPRPGKPEAESVPSSERRTPPPVAPSPSSTGSWPNTDSVSMPPCGNSPSWPPTPCCPPETNGMVGNPAAPISPSKPPSPPATGAADGSPNTSTSNPAPIHGGYPKY